MKTEYQDTISLTAGLHPFLQKKIIGQEHIIPRACSVLERARLGLNPPGKPLWSLLLLGPTGVGKTQFTIESTNYLFGNDALFRFDMSEFLHADSVKFFLGDETGRVGRLGQILDFHASGTLLFDEFEKAHPTIWDLYLQMLDCGRITLANHHTYDLSNFGINLTSNIGSHLLLRPTRLPFTTIERAVTAEAHRILRPEFLGRFDDLLVFKALSPEVQREIAKAAAAGELMRVKALGFDLSMGDGSFEFLVRRGIHKTLGARPMKRIVQKYIGDAIREALQLGFGASGSLIVSPDGDRLKIEAVAG